MGFVAKIGQTKFFHHFHLSMQLVEKVGWSNFFKSFHEFQTIDANPNAVRNKPVMFT